MTKTFAQSGIIDSLISALQKMKIIEPTEIQTEAIPHILAGKDVLGQSETGTGKTLAYLLPLVQKIERQKRENQVIILAPTHELALQIEKEIGELAKHSGLAASSAAIIGNVNILRQIEKLKEKPHFIVGSPGRILELIKKKKINGQTIKTIVIDEADRLFDEHHVHDVKAVIKTTLAERQLLLFSATLPEKSLTLALSLLKSPVRIMIGKNPQANVAKTITHSYFLAEARDKFEVLRKLLRIIEPEKALIFVNKSEEIEKTVAKLNYHGLPACGIHGSGKKEERQKAMDEFRKGTLALMVASDIAARGLDIKGLTHIINLDFPEETQNYLHRVGRTGRGGKAGTALSIITSREYPLLKKTERDFKITIYYQDMYKGKIVPGKRKSESPIKKREEIPMGKKGEKTGKSETRSLGKSMGKPMKTRNTSKPGGKKER